MKKHIVILTSLIVLLSAALVLFFLNARFTPVVAATQARSIDGLFALLFSIAAVIFTMCLVALVYCAIVFRHRPGDMEDGPSWHGHAGAETLWTLIPLAIVLFLGVYGANVLKDITQAPDSRDELEVRVTAGQWSWFFEYPQYGITGSQLNLPVNRPVLFKLASRDVIHSFWVPEFRVKMDAVPGMETVLRVTPSQVGQYKLLCAELCGLAHTIMQAPTTVMEAADFEKWVAEQRKR